MELNSYFSYLYKNHVVTFLNSKTILILEHIPVFNLSLQSKFENDSIAFMK